MCKKKRKKWARLGICSLFLGAVALAGLLFGAQAVYALDSGPTTTGNNVCLQPLYSGSAPVTNANRVGCTANDIKIARATSVSPTTCVSGSTFTLTATFEVNVTANERYDAAFIFDIGGDDVNNDGVLDGNGARQGFCSESILTKTVSPAQDLDGDFCGDLNAGTVNVTFTIPNVQCKDTDGDGQLNLPNCTSWHSNQGTVCSGFSTAGPETKSKCVCDDTFQVPVEVQKVNLNVVKTANPTQVNEPGGSVQFTVTVTNPATVVSVDLTELVDDPDNDPDTDNSITFNSTSTPTLATICGNNTHLDPGESTTCIFTRNISGNAGQSFTDKACVSGTDSNTPANPVGPTCATASVSIKDVVPTAAVAKTVEGLVCAQVQYKIKVDNTDTAESLQLTALNDNKFGNIAGPATLGPDVIATECSVPQTIAASGSYECKFTAEFCGASTHTNHVTGTLNDNDGNTITPTSTPDTSVTVTTTSP